MSETVRRDPMHSSLAKTMPRQRLAAVQAAPVYLDLDATVEKACALIAEAGKNKADVIVFPEGFLPGFPHWHDFFNARDPRVGALARRLYLNSVEVPGPVTEVLGHAARQAGAYVVMGINERIKNSPGTIYNGQLMFDRNGNLIGHRRKIMPTFMERLIHSSGDGRDVQVAETDFGHLGALICGENSNPLLRYALLAQGELIHAMSWPSFPLRHQKNNLASLDFRMRNYAHEGKVFVVGAAEVFTPQMGEAMGLDDKQMEVVVGAGAYSLIVNPSGVVLAGPVPDQETILYADAELEQIIEGRMVHHVTGHYQRLDIFQVSVNQKPLLPLHMQPLQGGDVDVQRVIGESDGQGGKPA